MSMRAKMKWGAAASARGIKLLFEILRVRAVATAETRLLSHRPTLAKEHSFSPGDRDGLSIADLTSCSLISMTST
ncbi:hypothetical protein C8Q74DRAFT_522899 [Fomes fomentarius]|nr:hypothetical protein C8Q74DRAFT_522899 [Fomes fomentarius]